MEMTMRKTIIALLVVPLISALTAQAASASERHHVRTKVRPVAREQLWNSNAYYAEPGYNAYDAYPAPVYPGYIAAPSYLSNEANGAMASGLAGH
jgi:hypothetical protein